MENDQNLCFINVQRFSQRKRNTSERGNLQYTYTKFISQFYFTDFEMRYCSVEPNANDDKKIQFDGEVGTET